MVREAHNKLKEASDLLRGYLPKGTVVLFQTGTMVSAHRAEVLSTSVTKWPQVHIKNLKTGRRRWISLDAVSARGL